MRGFLDECTVKLSGAKITKADLYEAYVRFSEGVALGMTEFTRHIKRHGIGDARTSGARCWEGIALKQEWRRSMSA